jgi:hypothetical protein
VPDPVGRSTYYQCADIRIIPALSDEGGCSLEPRAGRAALPSLAALSLLAVASCLRRRRSIGRA